MQVGKDKVVSIDYTLTNNSGQVLDSSQGREPLAYLHGNQNIIPGLEAALDGKNVGEQVKAVIAPKDAYGEKDQSLVQPVPRNMFPQGQPIQVGQQFQAQSQHGTRVVKVVAVDDQNVTIDANHPLAGETLNFDVTIREVRNATAEEIAHGHVHGAGGHQH